MELDRIFTSHMIFQKGKPIKIYGRGSGAVHIYFAGQKMSVVSFDGSWEAVFSPMEYGGPYEMTVIFPDKTVSLSDIYIGEVILFAGQSNMQMKVKETNAPKRYFKKDDLIRVFSTDRLEKSDFYTAKDGWVVAKRTEEFAAIPYFTALRLRKKLKIAIGVICLYQGASVIESWVREGAFKRIGITLLDEEKFMDHHLEEVSLWNKDGVLYNFGLYQVVPYPISSVVWYQGESDTSEEEGKVYKEELGELIRIWREDFSDEKLPFIIIQIADCRERMSEGWRLVQKAQAEIEKEIPFVKTVISKDVCEADDIHPKTKHLLSKRVADKVVSYIEPSVKKSLIYFIDKRKNKR